jgi:hypothetical protein
MKTLRNAAAAVGSILGLVLLASGTVTHLDIAVAGTRRGGRTRSRNHCRY